MLKPCKYLDHTNRYAGTCTLCTIQHPDCIIKYWHRNTVPYIGAPENVQFCGESRGRINSILDCYTPDEMACYKPTEREEKPHA